MSAANATSATASQIRRRRRGGGADGFAVAIEVRLRQGRTRMLRARAPLIAAFGLLPALYGCSEAPAAEAGTSTTVTAAVDALFAGDSADETRAAIVVRDGRTVAERYA